MSLPAWLREVQRYWFVRRPSAGARRRGQRVKAPRRVRLQVENLEDRLTPAGMPVTINVMPSTADLIAKIDDADRMTGTPVILELATGFTYVLTQPDNPETRSTTAPGGAPGPEDNNWYGPNGLPAIDNDITIEG